MASLSLPSGPAGPTECRAAPATGLARALPTSIRREESFIVLLRIAGPVVLCLGVRNAGLEGLGVGLMTWGDGFQ
jgi:hypothetical protein